MDAKQALRRRVHDRREELGRREMERLGEKLSAALRQAPLYLNAQRVLLYCSMPLEIGPAPCWP